MAAKADKKVAEQQERLQQILNGLLKDEENKYCADCEAKGPRWASWNLGVFLCIRCAGIHRNLGVHISKVKSVNLDSWTPQQVQLMRLIGNSTARAVYEANLPPTFRRPKSDSLVESFIKSKYVQKRYAKKGWVPPTVCAEEAAREFEHQLQAEAKAQQYATHTKAKTPVKKQTIPASVPSVKPSVSDHTTPNCSTPAEEDLANVDFGHASFLPFDEVSAIKPSEDSSKLELNVIDLRIEGDSQVESSMSSLGDQKITKNGNLSSKTADTQLLTPEPLASAATTKCRKTKEDIMALYEQGSGGNPLSMRPVDGLFSSFFSGSGSACSSSAAGTNFPSVTTPSHFSAGSADCLSVSGYTFDCANHGGLSRSTYSAGCLPAPHPPQNSSSYDELLNSILTRRN